jgi:uncharacterized protein (TIGR02271 family)
VKNLSRLHKRTNSRFNNSLALVITVAPWANSYGGTRPRETPIGTSTRTVVGKRAVQSGRVRIYGRETEKPVEDSVRLRNEHVTIERRSVDRPIAEADRSNEEVIEITEMKEEPVVGKRERVVEEIVLGKTAEEHTETVRDTVRRKDVEVERSDEANFPRDERHK